MKFLSKPYLEIHLAVLLFGCAGLFGNLIHLSAEGIVLGRAFLGSVFIYFLGKFSGEKFQLKSSKDFFIFVLLGIILAIHWVAFFKSIQLASVAIGLLMFSTFPIFTTFLEPLVKKEKIKLLDLVLALITFGGVALVMPSLELKNQDTQGALWGIASGFSFSVLALISKQMGSKYSSNVVSSGQNGVAALVLMPFFWQDILVGTWNDWGYLLVLGIIFTGIAHTLFISGMQGMKAQTASLIACLEPVYGIFLAWLLFHEIPTFRMLLGGMVILGVAGYATVVVPKFSKKS